MEIKLNFTRASDPPLKSGKYFIVTYGGGFYTLDYSVKHKAFGINDLAKDKKNAIQNVRMWAELPPRLGEMILC